MRERLVELLRDTFNYTKGVCIDFDEAVEINADYLIENGVVLLPCKVGDVVYRIYTRSWIGEDVVGDFIIAKDGLYYTDDKNRMTSCDKFGKTVFLTREEAEAKLKGE